MKLVKHLHPDAAASAGTLSETTSTTKTVKKGYSPEAFSDIGSTAKRTNEKWKTVPAITLLWTTQPDFETLVTAFNTSVTEQSTDAGNKPVQTQTLKQMDTSMNNTINDVKGGIVNKFKKPNATAQFARYGIVKEARSYVLPRDRDKRLVNLELMIAAIHEDGFDNEDWGKAYWTDMKTNYEKTLQTSGTNDGTISIGSSGLVSMAKQIAKISTALRYVLRGNYPDTYKAVYRDWGWQKENY